MKSKKILILCIIVAAGFFSACENLLDKEPLVQLSSTTFWKAESDVQAALTATYSTYRTSIFGSARAANGVSFDIESLSDNAIVTSSFASYATIMAGGINASTGGAISQYWSDCYNGIAKCNYFLNNIDATKSFLTTVNYRKYKGEALFNRCFLYNELVQLYGDVPLVLTPQGIGSGYDKMPRTPKADIVSKIITDIDTAIACLPNVAYADGHAVKGSAIMLKVRILMNNQRFAEAATAAWSLIGDPANPFALHNNYLGIFFNEQKNNKEIMFSVQYASPDDYHQLDQYVSSRMSCFPTPQLRDAYEVKNVVTGEKDPRLKMTIFQKGDHWVNNIISHKFTNDDKGSRSEGTIPFTNMAFKKWIDTTIYIANSSNLSAQHIVKMRYAELLLSYAEAMFESGQGSDPRALKALNDVRARKGVEMPPKTELTRDAIRNERRVELAYEGLRYNDLIRWGTAHEVIPTIKYHQSGNMRKFNGYVWPIPQAEMDKMEGVWIQNDGY